MQCKDFIVLIIVLSVAFINLIIWGISVAYFPKISNENYLIETIQAISLFIGFVILSLVTYKTNTGGYTIMFLGICLLYFTFFIRELDFDNIEGEAELWSLAKSPGLLYALAAAWIAAFLLALFRMTDTLRAFRNWIQSTEGNLLVAAGSFYLLGDFFEKNLIGLSYASSVFFEELFEINATTLMLLCALSALVCAKRYELEKRTC